MGDTSVVVRVGRSWRGGELGGRGSTIAVVLDKCGVLRHKYEDLTELGMG